MPDFAYTARDTTGRKVTGIISAANQREVLSQLATKSLFPLSVDTSMAEAAERRSHRRVKPQLMATTYSQLSGLLRSGVPLLRSIDVLRNQSSHGALKEVLSHVYSDVEEGATLAEAMATHPKAFSEMAVSMVRAGGEGGFLEDALARVAQFTEQQADLKGRTAGALAYPVFLAVVGMIVIFVLIVFFVPRFEVLFARLKERGELPAVTEWLLGTSSVLGRYGWIPLVAIGILFWLGSRSAANRIRQTGAGPVAIADSDGGKDLLEPRGRPILPRARNASAQRRADFEVAGDQRCSGGEPCPGHGH